ncbi:MAG TPA: hypothetical protein VEH84_03390 [Alphaproteobacteria bacterium]|nr:hypothetical protein [Alphaproteobacteria bacterium]
MTIGALSGAAPASLAADAVALKAGQGRTQIAVAALKAAGQQDRIALELLQSASPDSPRGSIVDIRA